jgi:hypothetical protein
VTVTRDKELSFVGKMTKSFLYFAYGSNLLAQRIHVNNPSAVRKEIGKLEASTSTQKTYYAIESTNVYKLDEGIEANGYTHNRKKCMLKSAFSMCLSV